MITTHLITLFFNTTTPAVGVGEYFTTWYFEPTYFRQLGRTPLIDVTADTIEVLVEAYLDGAWTNITQDVHSPSGIRIASGIDGNGPLDCVASPGECLFALNNSASGGRVLGRYSPFHANVRSGWIWGVPIRVSAYDPLTDQFVVLHRGKAWVIDPVPGERGERVVRVASYDGMYELMEALVQLGIYTNSTESDLITAVLDAVPAESQPVARSIDTGVDIFPYAFFDLGNGENAIGLIQDLAVDSQGVVIIRGDGTFVFRSRATRTGASLGTFTNTMSGFVAPTSLDQAFNVVRVTIAPPDIDPDATSILYADETVRGVAPGQTQEFTVAFTDHTNTSRTLIGGLVSGVVYSANQLPEGTGADLTSYVSVALYAWGSGARLTVTNAHPTYVAYLADALGQPLLKILGQGYSEGVDQTYTASSIQAYPSRELNVRLRYQSSDFVALSYAQSMESQRHALVNQPEQMEFAVRTPSALMTQALSRDVGDVITVTETMTGYTDVNAVIQSREIEIHEGHIVTVRWGLAPAVPFDSWTLDESAFDDETVLGF